MNRLQTQHQGRPSVETVNDDGKVVLETVLVDSRNRREACNIAKHRPHIVQLNVVDRLRALGLPSSPPHHQGAAGDGGSRIRNQ